MCFNVKQIRFGEYVYFEEDGCICRSKVEEAGKKSQYRGRNPKTPPNSFAYSLFILTGTNKETPTQLPLLNPNLELIRGIFLAFCTDFSAT